MWLAPFVKVAFTCENTRGGGFEQLEEHLKTCWLLAEIRQHLYWYVYNVHISQPYFLHSGIFPRSEQATSWLATNFFLSLRRNLQVQGYGGYGVSSKHVSFAQGGFFK